MLRGELCSYPTHSPQTTMQMLSPFPWPHQTGGEWRDWCWSSLPAPPVFLVSCLHTATSDLRHHNNQVYQHWPTFHRISVRAPTNMSTWTNWSGFRRFSLQYTHWEEIIDTRPVIIVWLHINFTFNINNTYIWSLCWLKALILSAEVGLSLDFFFFGLSLPRSNYII